MDKIRVVLNLNKHVIRVYRDIDEVNVELLAETKIDIYKCSTSEALRIVREIVEQLLSKIHDSEVKKLNQLAIRLNKHEGNKKDIRIHGEAATSDRVQFNVTRKAVEDNRKTS